jgi:hypothetical protein
LRKHLEAKGKNKNRQYNRRAGTSASKTARKYVIYDETDIIAAWQDGVPVDVQTLVGKNLNKGSWVIARSDNANNLDYTDVEIDEDGFIYEDDDDYESLKNHKGCIVVDRETGKPTEGLISAVVIGTIVGGAAVCATKLEKPKEPEKEPVMPPLEIVTPPDQPRFEVVEIKRSQPVDIPKPLVQRDPIQEAEMDRLMMELALANSKIDELEKITGPIAQARVKESGKRANSVKRSKAALVKKITKVEVPASYEIEEPEVPLKKKEKKAVVKSTVSKPEEGWIEVDSKNHKAGTKVNHEEVDVYIPRWLSNRLTESRMLAIKAEPKGKAQYMINGEIFDYFVNNDIETLPREQMDYYRNQTDRYKSAVRAQKRHLPPKEALVASSPSFQTSAVTQYTGQVLDLQDRIIGSFVVTFGGVMINKHVYRQGHWLKYAERKFQMPLANEDQKTYHDDLFFIPKVDGMPSGLTARFLELPAVGQKLLLVDQFGSHPGIVTAVEGGDVVYTCSTRSGSCGGVCLNTNGRLVAIHYSAGEPGKDNRGIAVTTEIKNRVAVNAANPLN